MTRESVVLQDVESALAEYRWYIMPRTKIWEGTKDWSVWKDIDPQRYCGVLWRNNVGGMQSKRGRFVRFGIVGLPDYTGWLFKSGRYVSLEVKTHAKGSEETYDQEAHGHLVEITGAIRAVVRSYEDTQELCKDLGLVKF